jgi:hypothetical protein
MTTNHPQPAPEVLIQIEVDGEEGPMSGVPLGWTERQEFQYTWTGILRLLLLQNRHVQVEVTILDVAVPESTEKPAPGAPRRSAEAAVPFTAVPFTAGDWQELRRAEDTQKAAARLLGTCQGLIECFEANDPWTPEARANAISELRKGIKELTNGNP